MYLTFVCKVTIINYKMLGKTKYNNRLNPNKLIRYFIFIQFMLKYDKIIRFIIINKYIF